MSDNEDNKETVHGTPTDGMMCLCTMEDITIEDGNYVEYQCYPSMKWKSALYEKCVVEQLLQNQFNDFVKRVKETDCQAELRRLLAAGPPIYISDKHALPIDEDNGDTHIINLWYCDNPNEIISAKLHNAVDGEERQELWNSLKEFIITEGGDDDDNDDDDKKDGEGQGSASQS